MSECWVIGSVHSARERCSRESVQITRERIFRVNVKSAIERCF